MKNEHCIARNPNAGGRCQRVATVNERCPLHQDWQVTDMFVPSSDWTDAYETMTDIAEGIDDLITWALANRPAGGILEDVHALGTAYRKMFARIDAVRVLSQQQNRPRLTVVEGM